MARKHYQANRDRYAARSKSRSPKKRAAHVAVERALTNGAMRRQPCETCGAKPAEAHHDDYSKPLSVRWLCRSHHQAWHRENGAAPNG
jgi:hypothetical protein